MQKSVDAGGIEPPTRATSGGLDRARHLGALAADSTGDPSARDSVPRHALARTGHVAVAPAPVEVLEPKLGFVGGLVLLDALLFALTAVVLATHQCHVIHAALEARFGLAILLVTAH
jgi:hypothetical protein